MRVDETAISAKLFFKREVNVSLAHGGDDQVFVCQEQRRMTTTLRPNQRGTRIPRATTNRKINPPVRRSQPVVTTTTPRTTDPTAIKAPNDDNETILDRRKDPKSLTTNRHNDGTEGDAGGSCKRIVPSNQTAIDHQEDMKQSADEVETEHSAVAPSTPTLIGNNTDRLESSLPSSPPPPRKQQQDDDERESLQEEITFVWHTDATIPRSNVASHKQQAQASPQLQRPVGAHTPLALTTANSSATTTTSHSYPHHVRRRSSSSSTTTASGSLHTCTSTNTASYPRSTAATVRSLAGSTSSITTTSSSLRHLHAMEFKKRQQELAFGLQRRNHKARSSSQFPSHVYYYAPKGSSSTPATAQLRHALEAASRRFAHPEMGTTPPTKFLRSKPMASSVSSTHASTTGTSPIATTNTPPSPSTAQDDELHRNTDPRPLPCNTSSNPVPSNNNHDTVSITSSNSTMTGSSSNLDGLVRQLARFQPPIQPEFDDDDDDHPNPVDNQNDDAVEDDLSPLWQLADPKHADGSSPTRAERSDLGVVQPNSPESRGSSSSDEIVSSVETQTITLKATDSIEEEHGDEEEYEEDAIDKESKVDEDDEEEDIVLLPDDLDEHVLSSDGEGEHDETIPQESKSHQVNVSGKETSQDQDGAHDVLDSDELASDETDILDDTDVDDETTESDDDDDEDEELLIRPVLPSASSWSTAVSFLVPCHGPFGTPSSLLCVRKDAHAAWQLCREEGGLLPPPAVVPSPSSQPSLVESPTAAATLHPTKYTTNLDKAKTLSQTHILASCQTPGSATIRLNCSEETSSIGDNDERERIFLSFSTLTTKEKPRSEFFLWTELGVSLLIWYICMLLLFSSSDEPLDWTMVAARTTAVV